MVYIGMDQSYVMSKWESYSPIEKAIGQMVQVDE